MSDLSKPKNRINAYLGKLTGDYTGELPLPDDQMEEYLRRLAVSVGGDGNGGLKIEIIEAVKKDGADEYYIPLPDWCNYWAPDTDREKTKQDDVLAVAFYASDSSYGFTFIDGHNGGTGINGGVYISNEHNLEFGSSSFYFDFYTDPDNPDVQVAHGRLSFPTDTLNPPVRAKCIIIKLKDKAVLN